MKRREFLTLGVGAGFALSTLRFMSDSALAAGQTLRILVEDSPNTVDPAGTGYNSASASITWNVYDRLVTYGSKPVEGTDGGSIYDYDNIIGQAAERYEVSPDGTQITFYMRPGATFHDGTPVTAHDAKWSLDRAVSVPTSKAQIATGSWTDPDQFVVVDDMTLRATLPQADRFALPNLSILFPAIFNSKVAKAHATAEDPWAQEYLKGNVAGGGPFKLSRFTADQGYQLEKFDDWKNGAPIANDRIMAQVVPVTSSRRAAAERKEADLVRGLSGRDIKDLLAADKVRIMGINNPGAVTGIALNSQMAPFDNPKVRQAIAYAVPYQQIFDSVLYERGAPMFGGSWETTDISYPQPLPYTYDLEKAKALLAEAGYADGFETTFTIDSALALQAEPVAILLQESLGKIGVTMKIEKVPSGQMGTLQTERKLPMYIATGSAWLRNPDYFFRIFYSSPRRWNYGNFQNAEMDQLVAETRFETDPAVYEAKVKRMIDIAKAEVPLIMLWSPSQDTALSEGLEGYTYMFHNQLELRHLKKT